MTKERLRQQIKLKILSELTTEEETTENIMQLIDSYLEQLSLCSVTPRFSVSLVYQNNNASMLRVMIVNAQNEYEALGKAQDYFKEESKNMGLILKTVIHLNEG